MTGFRGPRLGGTVDSSQGTLPTNPAGLAHQAASCQRSMDCEGSVLGSAATPPRDHSRSSLPCGRYSHSCFTRLLASVKLFAQHIHSSLVRLFYGRDQNADALFVSRRFFQELVQNLLLLKGQVNLDASQRTQPATFVLAYAGL